MPCLQYIHMVIKEILQGHPRSYFSFDDLFRAELFQVHDQGTQAVAMSYHQHILPFRKQRKDMRFKIGYGAIVGILQALTPGGATS